MIEYENKYSQYLHKFTIIKNSISEDKLSLLEISIRSILGKRALKSWLFTNECLSYLINKDIDKLPEWLIQLINIELNRRKDLITLKNSFLQIKHDHELAEILGLNYGTLVYHIFKVPDERKYRIFKIPKKSGGFRTLCSPISNIKLIQKKLSEILNEIYTPRINAHGFIPGRSIVSNARIHVRQNAILNIDIKDYFPTINFGRVRGLFLSKPFNFPKWIATLLAQICTYQNQLPQGSPVSPIISNMVCSKLDNRISMLSKKYCCYFTRYADDITLSTNKYDFPSEFIRQIRIIIEEEGFSVNENKFRIQKKNQRKEVTGITVNEKLNVKRKYIRNIRAILSSWEKFGYDQANTHFYNRIKLTYPHIKFLPRLDNSLHGMIDYVGQVRGKKDEIYNKFIHKFFSLLKKPINFVNNQDKDPSIINNEKLISEPLISNNEQFCLKHQPKRTTEILKYFQDNNKFVKFLTHDAPLETIYDLGKIIKKSKKEIKDSENDIPLFLFKKINKFINDHKKTEFIKWAKENPNKSLYSSCQIPEYRKLVDDFKFSISFKSGNLKDFFVDLLDNFVDVNTGKQPFRNGINYELVNLDIARFYTDKDHFKIALNHILKSLIEHSNGTKYLEISYVYNIIDKKHLIKLVDINSKMMVSPDPDIFIGGDFSNAKEHLFSLCDWSIESEFLHNNFKRTYVLPINKNVETIDPVNGLTHIFSFYA